MIPSPTNRSETGWASPIWLSIVLACGMAWSLAGRSLFAASAPVLVNPRIEDRTLRFFVPGAGPSTHQVEFKSALDESEWQEWASVTAEPGGLDVSVPIQGSSQRFFRVRERGTGNGGAIRGRVQLLGTPPAETPIVMDSPCARLHPGGVTTRHFLVGAESGLENTVVFIQGPLAAESTVPAAPLLIDQTGCLCEPYVAAGRAGQQVLVRNSDPVLHGIVFTSAIPTNQTASKSQVPGGADLAFTFPAPELFLRMSDSSHPWKLAYLSFFDHPFFAVSGAGGVFELPAGLPVGEYLLTAAHRRAGTNHLRLRVTGAPIDDVRLILDIRTPRSGSLSLPSSALPLHEQSQLVFQVFFEDNQARDVAGQAAYTSSQPAVAAVEPDGRILGKSIGRTTITAVFNQFIRTLEIEVFDPATAIRVSGEVVDEAGKPVPGAELVAYDSVVSPAITDALGRFQLPAFPRPTGDLKLSARKRVGTELLTAFHRVAPAGPSITTPRFVLRPFAFSRHSVSAGTNFVLALGRDGRLRGWGANGSGQLAIGSLTSQSLPAEVTADQPWWTVAAGHQHGVALQTNGTLWSWGSIQFGQTGLGTAIQGNVTRPRQVGNDTRWRAVSAGGAHTLAITADRTLRAWGYNRSGQLGVGTYDIAASPVDLQLNGLWDQISAGDEHSAAIREDGTLWIWGSNGRSQLGFGAISPGTNRPALLLPSMTWKSVACGVNHTLAVRSDGTLWSWGFNTEGQLGDGTTTTSHAPKQIGTSSLWVAVEAGASCSLALDESGTLWAWGNTGRSLPNSDSTSLVDVTFKSPSSLGQGFSWADMSAGYRFAVAKRADSTMWTWGIHGTGQLGIGTIDRRRHPARLLAEPPFTAIAAGTFHFQIIDQNSKLWTWGMNGQGRLGVGGNNARLHPVLVNTGAGWRTSAGGGHHDNPASDGHGLAIDLQERLWSWGGNSRGQLGRGNTAGTTTAQLVPGTADSWKEVSAGGRHSVALTRNGVLHACGDNEFGQVGDGTTQNQTTFRRLREDLKWGAVAAGQYHTLALTDTGRLFSWGGNGHGQLGLGNTTITRSPTEVIPSQRWRHVASGAAHSLVIREDGTLWGWGWNEARQLGVASDSRQTTPVQVDSSPWKTVAAGFAHSLGIRQDGTLWAWGNNSYGQIGDGTLENALVPTRIGNASRWVAVAAGSTSSVALDEQGTVWLWGSNPNSLLGATEMLQVPGSATW